MFICYDFFSCVFYWLIVIVVIIVFIFGFGGFGWLMYCGVDFVMWLDIVWYELLGLLVLVLMLLCLVWVVLCLGKLEFEMVVWMCVLLKLVYGVLWVLLLVLLVMVLLVLGSEYYLLMLLGGVWVDELFWIVGLCLGEVVDWGDVYGLLGDVLMWLVGLYVLVVIYYYVVCWDGVLVVMLFWLIWC